LLFTIRSYFFYWLKKEDRFSQHSPFVFRIYSDLISFLEAHENGNLKIEKFREALLKDKSRIKVHDLGAGSKKIPHSVRRVSDITRFSTSSIKFANLYRYFCSLTPAENIIELGTCVGISTRYLSTKTKGILYTLEGSAEIQKVAMREPKPSNTKFILGPIAQTLPQLLSQIQKVDFALIDANHTYEGTIFAFNTLLEKANSKTIFAIADIHWSPEMEQAWIELKSKHEVKLTVDFFECGIIFFEYPGEKTDLVLEI
jgi:hypothetical protein